VFTFAWATSAAIIDKKLQVLRHRSPVDSCVDCIEWESDGWVDYDSEDFHPIGTSICGARCLCSLEFRLVSITEEAEGG
jgi:hypothetical protein